MAFLDPTGNQSVSGVPLWQQPTPVPTPTAPTYPSMGEQSVRGPTGDPTIVDYSGSPVTGDVLSAQDANPPPANNPPPGNNDTPAPAQPNPWDMFGQENPNSNYQEYQSQYANPDEYMNAVKDEYQQKLGY